MLYRSKLWFCLLTTALIVHLFAEAFPVNAETAPTAAQVARQLGYGPADMKAILSGEIVSLPLMEETKKELAMTMAMLLKTPVPDLLAHIRTGNVYRMDQTVQDLKFFPDGPVSAASFAGLKLGAAEIEKLSNVKPGTTYNLSKEEIKSIRAVAA